MKLFCVRHGQTDWNVKGKFQGRTDIPLNSKGLRQAHSVAEMLSGLSLDSVWSSELSRSRQTAEKIASFHDLEVNISEGITEISHGKWEGLVAYQIEQKWPGMLEKWHLDPHMVTMPDGENLLDVQKRAVNTISEIISSEHENIAIVSHDAVLKVLLCHWLGCPVRSFWRFQLSNCSITLVEYNNIGIRIPLMGSTSHLGDVFTREEQKGL